MEFGLEMSGEKTRAAGEQEPHVEHEERRSRNADDRKEASH